MASFWNGEEEVGMLACESPFALRGKDGRKGLRRDWGAAFAWFGEVELGWLGDLRIGVQVGLSFGCESS